MARGTIKKIIADRGFGFIKHQGSADVFFHVTAVQGTKFESLNEGQEVEFECGEQGLDSNKPRAIAVSIP